MSTIINIAQTSFLSPISCATWAFFMEHLVAMEKYAAVMTSSPKPPAWPTLAPFNASLLSSHLQSTAYCLSFQLCALCRRRAGQSLLDYFTWMQKLLFWKKNLVTVRWIVFLRGLPWHWDTSKPVSVFSIVLQVAGFSKLHSVDRDPWSCHASWYMFHSLNQFQLIRLFTIKE